MTIDWRGIAEANGWNDDKTMLEQIYKVEKSCNETGCLLGVSFQSVSNRLKHHKCKLRPPGGPNFKGDPKSFLSLDRIDNDRFKDMTIKEISEEFNIKKYTVYNYMYRYNLQYKRVRVK